MVVVCGCLLLWFFWVVGGWLGWFYVVVGVVGVCVLEWDGDD